MDNAHRTARMVKKDLEKAGTLEGRKTFNRRDLHSGQPLRDLRCDLRGPIIDKENRSLE